MAVPFNAVAMADTPGRDEEALADLRVAFAFTVSQGGTPTLNQSQVRHQSSAVILIAQIRPDDIVEYVRLECLDGAGKPGYLLWSRPREPGGVDDEARDVV